MFCYYGGMDKPKVNKKVDKSISKPPLMEENPRGFAVTSLKARADAKRTLTEKFADWVTSAAGSVTFLTLNIIWFGTWIVVNMDMIPGVAPFDPFPFGLLTMIVSLEAICLAVLVLLSQNRESRIADVREEIDLHINKIAEAEITQIIKMLAQIMEKEGINTKKDLILQRMLKPISSSDIQRKIEQQTAHQNNLSLSDLPRAPWDEPSKRKAS